MKEEEIYKELDKIFQEVFDDDDIHVNEKTTADDIEEWDSLEHITLIVSIENHFKIIFNIKEVT